MTRALFWPGTHIKSRIFESTHKLGTLLQNPSTRLRSVEHPCLRSEHNMKVKHSPRSQTALHSENCYAHTGRVCRISLVSLRPRCHSYHGVRRWLARCCYLFGAQRSSQCSRCFSLFTLSLFPFHSLSLSLISFSFQSCFIGFARARKLTFTIQLRQSNTKCLL